MEGHPEVSRLRAGLAAYLYRAQQLRNRHFVRLPVVRGNLVRGHVEHERLAVELEEQADFLRLLYLVDSAVGEPPASGDPFAGLSRDDARQAAAFEFLDDDVLHLLSLVVHLVDVDDALDRAAALFLEEDLRLEDRRGLVEHLVLHDVRRRAFAHRDDALVDDERAYRYDEGRRDDGAHNALEREPRGLERDYLGVRGKLSEAEQRGEQTAHRYSKYDKPRHVVNEEPYDYAYRNALLYYELRHLEEQAARDEDYRKGDEAEEKRRFQLVQYEAVKSSYLKR